jgi:hypothetical protein
MTADTIADQFTADNRLYGFAVWQLLYSYLERGCVLNQLGAGDYDPESPQVVVVEFDHDRGELPIDWFQYKVVVAIDSKADFYEQKVVFIATSAENIQGTTYCTETSYKLSLDNAMALLPQLKQHAYLFSYSSY